MLISQKYSWKDPKESVMMQFDLGACASDPVVYATTGAFAFPYTSTAYRSNSLRKDVFVELWARYLATFTRLI